MGILEREALRKAWRERCAGICDAHSYPSEDLNAVGKLHTGMQFMILDELKEIRRLLENMNSEPKAIQKTGNTPFRTRKTDNTPV